MRLQPMLKYSLVLIFLFPLSVLGKVNKCIINGATTYTSKPCPENTLQSFEMLEPMEGSSPNASAYNSKKWYLDHTGYKKALKISLSRKTPLLIYGRTDWCPYCIKFNNTLLSNWEVNKVLSGFVKVKLNPEHSSEDKKLFESLGGKSYPSLFVQSGQKLTEKIKNPVTKQGDQWKIMSNEAFISILQEQLNKE